MSPQPARPALRGMSRHLSGALALLPMLAACAGPQAITPPAAAAAASGEAASVDHTSTLAAEATAPYRISAGDELRLRFFYTPTLDTVATVRPDGRLTLPLAGELQAAGLSVSELGSVVERALSATVRRPQVSVNLQGAGSQRVFVGGEVGRPGVQPLAGPLTAVQALMVAEGLKDTAHAGDALVLRRAADGSRQVLRLNLAAALNGTDPAQDLPLQALDVLVVPKSGVANLNLWVDQYIRRNLPFAAGFSYTINRNGVVQ